MATGYIPPVLVSKAKEMDLLTYLQIFEPDELVRVSDHEYCTKTHDSLKISNGKWMWWSRGVGGKNAVDYLVTVEEKTFYSAYLFGTLYMDRFFDYMVAGSKGTKMPRGDKQQIMNYPVVLPSKESLDLFNGIAAPMLDQISSNRIENTRLSALRDVLLPRLMSGDLDVSAIDF